MSALASPSASTLARLRAAVGALDPGARVGVHGGALGGRLPTGTPALDVWLRGWPRPGITELVGAPGSGRLAALIPTLAAVTKGRGHALILDPGHQAHPPGWEGVELAQVVVVRPPQERAAWVAEQAARSGALDMVLVLDAPPLGRAGLRLARAADAGSCAVFVVSPSSEADLPSALRLCAEGWDAEGAVRLRCVRSRDGRQEGERVFVPGEAAPEPRVAILRPAVWAAR